MKRFVVAAAVCALALSALGEVRFIQSPRAMKVPTAGSPRRVATEAAKEKWIGTRAIVRDAATGKLRRPTVAEATSLARSLKQLTSRPESINANATAAADGSRQGVINGAFANVVVGRPRADGTVETLCVQSFEEAAQFLGLEPEPAQTDK
jgi:hypothetical protein